MMVEIWVLELDLSKNLNFLKIIKPAFFYVGFFVYIYYVIKS